MLKIDRIDTYYGRVQALKQCSLDVAAGEFVTLLGANGAGKSTLLKSILGLQPVRGGAIEFMGERIDRQAPDAIIRKGISIVPEGRRVFPEFTVAENLVIGARARRSTHHEIQQDIERILAQFPRLKERYRQKAGTMSGGEQQMVAIGRALMGRPKLLLLDEPSLGLAPLVVAELMDKLREIHAAGATILLVEQNVTLALQTAQRGYLLETGQIVGSDDTQALLHSDLVRKTYLGMDG
ncbi:MULTISPECIES: ABC transporter ATP-binding protein [Bordetella]|uniref:ABC transporter ATP-binding protein n=1 Tax=Bordetella genomosp. 6 TaxID=463024 RepID=A0ABX4FEH9_9BORD|nr:MULTISPECIES: ABC transporter ATP-binding protein [Bordetella]KCV25423.1 ABC transporter, ATP-binding protein [Bordetella bronchiseptica 00-P-2730]AOB28667.1 ABC transporter ATP-binding protein [Bordetella bronchiseptica]ARP74998.1 ABC transporter ATP-binding protein [Bordetella genomosp. 6]AUL17411.1 ABC transporter ATP-binding protein [Bordetella bronchiseptica]AWP60647.1 ABC transporter ATP-binding protein [Bordetella bronchiseptica]